MPLLAWFTIWYLKGPKFLSNYSVTSSSVVIDYKYVIKNNNKNHSPVENIRPGARHVPNGNNRIYGVP